jgi:predicted RNase H-like HicB family nuclease
MGRRVEVNLSVDLHALVYPAADLPGTWVAHCLELDIISQGASDQDALRSLDEAINVIVEYNIQHGLMPLQIRLAPKEYWEAAGLPFPQEGLKVSVTVRQLDTGTEDEAGEFQRSMVPIVMDRAPVPVHAG